MHEIIPLGDTEPRTIRMRGRLEARDQALELARGNRLAIRRRARHTITMAVSVHGHFLAAEVGELAGVSGTTIGQWARRGYILSSASDGEPRVYSVEDVAEAAIVGELLGRGVAHADVRRAIERLAEEYGDWPLSDAPLGTALQRGRTRIVLRERDGLYALSPRGWQRIAAPPAVDEVRLQLNRGRRSRARGARAG